MTRIAQLTRTGLPAELRRTGVRAGRYDGVICFGGEDWWYHNRGHYDMQMMREISRRLPVLYVNSIGMRLPRPSEGRMFLHRVTRKLGSLRRGLTEVRPNFHVYSPKVLPGSLGLRLTGPALCLQARLATKRLGMQSPLLWIACPTAADVLDRVPNAGVVYQRTDRYESFHNVDAKNIATLDRRLKARADLTVFCSQALYDAESGECRRSAMIDHGVDFHRFRDAAEQRRVPPDVARIPRPRVGFVGGIDEHTFDPVLFNLVARRLPDVSFVLVGGCSLPEGWCEERNVHMLGQKPYEEVADYMAACDVLIMPWNDSPWIESCNPVKLKEYLAVGRPVVSTWFPELRNYDGCVHVARNAREFALEIRHALRRPEAPADLRRRVEGATWTHRARRAVDALRTAGVQAA